MTLGAHLLRHRRMGRRREQPGNLAAVRVVTAAAPPFLHRVAHVLPPEILARHVVTVEADIRIALQQQLFGRRRGMRRMTGQAVILRRGVDIGRGDQGLDFNQVF